MPPRGGPHDKEGPCCVMCCVPILSDAHLESVFPPPHPVIETGLSSGGKRKLVREAAHGKTPTHLLKITHMAQR